MSSRESSPEVFLVHWKEQEARSLVQKLKGAGFRASWKQLDNAVFKRLRQVSPSAIVIDLSRLPAQGRDVGLALRRAKGTRHVPLVFVGGVPDKVGMVRKLLPDAVYTDWHNIEDALNLAITNPLAHPIVPDSSMAGYSGTSLVKKLGIKPNTKLILVGAPADFEQTLGTLPKDVVVKRRLQGPADLIIWCVRTVKDLDLKLPRVLERMTRANGLWIAWPKKTSPVESDLTQAIVRRVGLAAGWVDHKICAIDSTWSALRFVIRKRQVQPKTRQ